MKQTPLIVFSNMRWNSLLRRPHHVMSRLASRRDVLFIEEPLRHHGKTQLELLSVGPRLSVVRPRLPLDGGAGSWPLGELEPALVRVLESRGWGTFTAWLDTPMAVRLARALGARAIVYDCVDELSALRFAPAELRERERELFQCADVVFTGGPSLHRAKRDAHRAVHCFPNSVDMSHFAGAIGLPEARELAELPRPRLGYFGAIDGRLDFEILRRLAVARPEWQIVLVGPVVRIDEALLPRAANLHFMGPRAYEDLPGFLAGWDVCLLPFSINASTRFLSPAQTLEYMAADRPIVSTPISDVVDPYGDIVYLGKGASGFLDACDRALHASDADRSIRRALGARVLRHSSWDETVNRMDGLLS